MEKKKIIVLGGLGVSERRDRDPDRIIYRGGVYMHFQHTLAMTDL